MFARRRDFEQEGITETWRDRSDATRYAKTFERAG